MQKIKILIVEDEPLIAEDLKYILGDFGYEVAAIAYSYQEAVSAIENTTFDLAILDIQLEEEKSGIDLAHLLKDEYKIPFIFLTSYSDKTTVNNAKTTEPLAYLVKPIDEKDIMTTIDIAMYNFNIKRKDNKINKLFIKEKNSYIKINIEDIQYVAADDNYSVIHTLDKKYLVSITLKIIEEKLGQWDFLRPHRSYLVNPSFISKITEEGLLIKDTVIPVSRRLRPILRKRLTFLDHSLK